MRKFYEGKLIRKAIVMILAFSFVGLLIVFYFYFKSLDDLAAENMRQRVMVALEVETSIQQEILEEYTFWDEAYDNCIENVNEKWISLNTGDYIFSQLGVAFSLAIDPSGSFTYVDAADDQKMSLYKQLLGPEIDSLLKKVPGSSLPTKVVSGYVTIGDDFYLVSVGPFISEKTKQIRFPASYLAFGKKIDSDYIKKIGEKYRLNNLDFRYRFEDCDHSLKIHDQANRLIGCVVWDKVYPSREILPFLTLVVCLFYLVASGICMVVLKREAGNIKEQEEHLYFMATKDYLTGVSNRRHVMELGQQMLAAHQRSACNLSVLVLDIDYFKTINDQFGHEVGDRALSSFSKLCSGVLRSSDVFGRFGGEEFLAVLHDTEIDEAVEVAERMRRTVEKGSVNSDGLPQLTVSIGVAVDFPGDDFEMIIRRADEALFKAKSKGRNLVEVYDGSDVG
ncbi:sensor domain-containing diguanylate cyclase [Maridesulfovibrio salexigens]|uniref:diguanylate cyclase n=1 Tax=Maridesulfovibrio salexigens (strain ATCC 14822 / DSM 2638 / NCIMB 8403 / VKM B-1763) TaxID=526222 RepID=C6BRI7_MARSD|nr:diguanylate cyclase [Maridesulfovibrio salexigens]ACS79427.1 diguanylate cyclase [Maridesulfovibrio salexigens DSM 2638]